MIKKCALCGSEFETRCNNHKYCNETCKKVAFNESHLKYYKKVHQKKERKKEVRRKMSELERMSVEARKHGMTYGKYVEYLYLQSEEYKHGKSRPQTDTEPKDS